MSIKVSDDGRSKMATFVRQTITNLEKAKFQVDMLVPPNASMATSRISSAYKRHGSILQRALAMAISTDPDYTVWEEAGFTDPAYPNGLQIDLAVFCKQNSCFEVFEVKRGLGRHDSDAKKGIAKRLNAATAGAHQFCLPHGVRPATTDAFVVSYYGSLAKTSGS